MTSESSSTVIVKSEILAKRRSWSIVAAILFVGLVGFLLYFRGTKTGRERRPLSEDSEKASLEIGNKPTGPLPVKDLTTTILQAGAGNPENAPADRRLQPGPPARIRNSLGMMFAYIPPGEFEMGTSEPIEDVRRDFDTTFLQFDDESPRRIRITRGFYLGIHEVTQEQFEKVAGENPSWFSETGRGRAVVGDMETGKHPVEFVSWNEAGEFCRQLSSRAEERMHRRIYRLPTEAEWEYSCRAGTTGQYSFERPEELRLHAWTATNSGGRTHPVGLLAPNAFGLFDMHGNVREWCLDWYTKQPPGPNDDPTGPNQVSHDRHVVRGGAWDQDERYGLLRCATRSHDRSNSRMARQGFRVVLELVEESNPGER